MEAKLAMLEQRDKLDAQERRVANAEELSDFFMAKYGMRESWALRNGIAIAGIGQRLHVLRIVNPNDIPGLLGNSVTRRDALIIKGIMEKERSEVVVATAEMVKL